MEKKMVYAVQIAPEFQESPLFLDLCFPENIIVTGNRDFKSHTTVEYDTLMENYDRMAWDWENYHDCTLAELLASYGFERLDGKTWTTVQRGKWRKLLESNYDFGDDEIILPALELITGIKWDVTCIKGYCQGDWQYMYYPVNQWDSNDIHRFESEYFNTGSEWHIHDGENTPEKPEDVIGYCEYFSDNMDIDDIKLYLANEHGVLVENVVLYVYTGSHSVADYKTA